MPLRIGWKRSAKLIGMRNLLFAAALLFAVSASAQQPVAARVAAQDALFKDVWETNLRLNPTSATSQGDYRYNDRLGDFSLTEIAHEHELAVGWLAKIKAIPADGFPDQAAISHDLFERQLQEEVDTYDLKSYEMPISGMGGVHTSVADLPLSMPFDSVKHYEDYIARLKQIPRAFQQTEELLKAGMNDHLVIVKFIAEKVPGQCDGVIKANPFLIPTRKFPASFSDADKKRLTDEITKALKEQVFPAYKQFSGFMTTTYIPAARTTLSIESLPGGKRRYQAALYQFTTTKLSAKEIHDIGLKEVDRIQGEMAALAKANGYKDLDSFRTAIENDPKYKAKSEEAILDDFRRYIAQMQPRLPELFRAAAEDGGNGGGDSGVPGGERDTLSAGNSGWEAAGTGVGCGDGLCASRLLKR